MAREICPSASRKSVAARRSRMSACGLRDSQGSVSNAGSVATPPAAPGKIPLKNRSVSASDSARRFESVTKKAGRRSSCVRYAATKAFATSCRPATETWLAPPRRVANAPSIAAWRSKASNLSRTAGSIMLGQSGFRARGARPFTNFLQNGGGRIAGHHGHGNDTAARSFDFFASHDLAAGPIAPLHQDIRKQARDHFERRWIVKDNYSVHAFQGSENLRALAFRDDGAAFTL